jgi:preprotein translocase subunit SecB
MTAQTNIDSISPEFSLQRIYAQVSSEIPNIPEVFNLEAAPHLDVNFHITHEKMASASDLYSVELKLLVNATNPAAKKSNEIKTIFLIEVRQGGLFQIRGVDDQTFDQMIKVHCPTILYPYASALVSDLVLRAGFMPLHLPPIDFGGLYRQDQQSKAAGE